MTSADDGKEGSDTNYELCVQSLKDAGTHGFQVRCFRIVSSDYGVPQRRMRLFFLGFNKKLHPNASFANVTSMLMNFKLKCQLPATHLTILATCSAIIVINNSCYVSFTMCTVQVRAAELNIFFALDFWKAN